MQPLTTVWNATNRHKTHSWSNGRSAASVPRHVVPGPYSMSEEAGVIEFVEWYCTAMLGAMGAQSTTQPPDEEVRIVKC